ncbi:MAG: XrtA/PEP-CTERM system TPR-repeat protein PrsT, partial [Betaproteobacteria bacterium]
MNGSTSFRPRMAILLLAASLAAGCGGDKPAALVASAKDYLARNDSKAAVIQLKNALQQDPDLAEARYLLGVALLRAEDVPAAQKELRKARELKYPPEQVDPPLAHATALLQQFQKVVDEFASSTAKSPEGVAELQTALGQAYAGLGKVDLARQAFAAALSADPRNGPALVADARLKAQTGDVAGALAQIDMTVAALPALADAWMLKGDIALYQRESDAAASAYRKTIEVRRDYLPAHAALVGLLIREGKAEEAATALAAMKVVAPRDPQTLYFTALARAQAGDYKSARDAIQQQLQILPDNLPGMLLAGSIDYELGAYGQAEASLLRVLQRAPEQSQARKLLIAAYVKEGQPAKALEALKPVLGGIGKDAAMLNVAGEVYLQAGEPATAARFFERSAALDPAGTRPRTGLALTRLAMGETDRGVRELEAAAAADTETRPDLALIATSLQQRQFDKALTAIDALEAKRPNMPMTPNLRGLALLGKSDNAGARKSFERALAIDPDFFPALANLSRLDIAEKKPAVAQKRLEDAIARKPANSQVVMALASMREHDKAPPEEVVALLNKAVAARPAEIAPHLALMDYFLRIKAPKRAVAAGEEALVAIPGRPEILEALGVAQQAAGDVNQAMANFKRWSEAAPGSPSPYLRIAELQAQQKDLDGAVQSLRKALAIKPDLVMAQRGLINLDLGNDRLREALAIARDVQKQRPTESTGF